MERVLKAPTNLKIKETLAGLTKMKYFVLLTALAFASKKESDVESAAAAAAANSRKSIMENVMENSTAVKTEEEEYVTHETTIKVDEHSKYRWGAEMTKDMQITHVDAKKQFAQCGIKVGWKITKVDGEALSDTNMENFQQILLSGTAREITFTFNEKRSSNYVGVSYNEKMKQWIVRRCNKTEKKQIYYGAYPDEEAAAHASDTLAKKLMANGEENHRLNFPDDDTEVYPKEKKTNYIGVSYREKMKRWSAARWSKNEKKLVYSGIYKDEETAAHASDTVARNLIANGEQKHKLNFPDDDTEVYPNEKTTASKYIGVYYNQKRRRWVVQRYSKMEKKNFNIGYYKDEETAAIVSDKFASKLMANGEQNHKINFPDHAEMFPEHQTNKRKRPFDFDYSQADGNLEKFEEKEK